MHYTEEYFKQLEREEMAESERQWAELRKASRRATFIKVMFVLLFVFGMIIANIAAFYIAYGD